MRVPFSVQENEPNKKKKNRDPEKRGPWTKSSGQAFLNKPKELVKKHLFFGVMKGTGGGLKKRAKGLKI